MPARFNQRLHKPAPHRRATHRVEEHADLDARARLLGEQVAKTSPNGVFLPDIELKMDMLGGGAHRRLKRVKGLGTRGEHLHLIARGRREDAFVLAQAKEVEA